MWQADGVMLGVDVGGTKVAAARVEGGRAHDRVEHPTDLDSAAELLDGIEAAVSEVVETAGAPAAIGVGVPSQIDFAAGRVLSSVNIPLEGVPLRDELTRRLGVPVFVDNDANVAALAESAAAPGGPETDVVMLTLGTGVGGGVVTSDEVFRGASGLGAELGHLVIDHQGPECPGNCPSRGCIEAFCSGTALARDATSFGRANPQSALGRVVAERGHATGRDAVEAAREGDGGALGLLRRLGTMLGVGVASIANAFEPHQIVIGGGLSKAGDLFLDMADRELRARALPVISERVSLSPARTGADAGVIGAGLLAAQEVARAEGRATTDVLESR